MSSRRAQYDCSILTSLSRTSFQTQNFKGPSQPSLAGKLSGANSHSTDFCNVINLEHSDILYSILMNGIESPAQSDSGDLNHDRMQGIEASLSEVESTQSHHNSFPQAMNHHLQTSCKVSGLEQEHVDASGNLAADWRPNDDISRTPSHDSLTSYDSRSTVGDEATPIKRHSSASVSSNGSNGSGRNVEDLIDQSLLSKLDRLTTAQNSNSNSPPTPFSFRGTPRSYSKSLSHPGTPPLPTRIEQPRKHSMGNQDLKRLAASSVFHADVDPVDLSFKRIRSDIGDVSFHTPPTITVNDDTTTSFFPENSILGAALRGRAATFSSPTTANLATVHSASDVSILETALRGRAATFSSGASRPLLAVSSRPVVANLNRTRLAGMNSINRDSRERVTLAKRNLNPVKSRVLERLNAMMAFVLNLPEFNALPVSDQQALLVGSVHRLLLLFMAESNLEFAVTTVHVDEPLPGLDSINMRLDEIEEGRIDDSNSQQRRLEVPTMQFVQSIQNFISKCQAIGIRPSEYFFMRWIVLFHAGKSQLERGEEVAALNTAARQDLQEIIADSHPNDKLRYSKLLLALHTVFGVNCRMLESLFCTPLNLKGGIEAFVCDALRVRHERDCTVTPGVVLS